MSAGGGTAAGTGTAPPAGVGRPRGESGANPVRGRWGPPAALRRRGAAPGQPSWESSSAAALLPCRSSWDSEECTGLEGRDLVRK